MNNGLNSNRECNGQKQRLRQRKCENGVKKGCGQGRQGQGRQRNKGANQ